MSLPLKIGRISLAVLSRSSSEEHFSNSSSRFSVDMIKASFKPVSTPRYMLISQSLRGVPTASIFCFIRSSIGDKMTQLLSFAKLLIEYCCSTKTLSSIKQKSHEYSGTRYFY